MRVEKAGDELYSADVAEISKRSKRKRLTIDSEPLDHMKVEGGDTMAVQNVTVDGKPGLLLTKAKWKLEPA